MLTLSDEDIVIHGSGWVLFVPAPWSMCPLIQSTATLWLSMICHATVKKSVVSKKSEFVEAV